jgi:hypothetical protein
VGGLALLAVGGTVWRSAHREPEVRRDATEPGIARRGAAQAEFSRRAQTTTAVPVPVLRPAEGEVETILARLLPRRDDNLSGLLHALHLFGREARVPSGEGRFVRILDLVLDGQRADAHFGTVGKVKTLFATPHGARYWLHEKFYLGTNQGGAEGHPGQMLASLAEHGVPLEQPLVLSDGTSGQLRLVLDDLLANLQLRDEIYWDGIALVLYLPPAKEWRDKFGRVWTFDDLATALMKKRLAAGPCAGTHTLITLALLARADRETPVLSEPVRCRVEEYLAAATNVLVSTQARDGYWGEDWVERMPNQGGWRSRPPSSDETRLLVTGHHLEWLTLQSPDRVPADVLARAGGWLLKALATQTRDPQWVREWYCPLTHAARTVCVVCGFDAARFEREFARTGRPGPGGGQPVEPAPPKEGAP